MFRSAREDRVRWGRQFYVGYTGLRDTQGTQVYVRNTLPVLLFLVHCPGCRLHCTRLHGSDTEESAASWWMLGLLSRDMTTR